MCTQKYTMYVCTYVRYVCHCMSICGYTQVILVSQFGALGDEESSLVQAT